MRDPQEAMLTASQSAKTHKRGLAIAVLCPFHEDHTPSCYLYEGNGGWYCWSCGVGGSAENFLRRTLFAHLPEGEAYKAAYAYLETSKPMTNAVPRTNMETWRAEARAENERTKERDMSAVHRYALAQAVSLYNLDLAAIRSPLALAYAESRGLLDSAGRALYMTGYCKGVGLADLLPTKEQQNAACDLGLLRLVDAEHRYFSEPFRGRLILVDMADNDRPRWLTGRAVPGCVPERVERERKYLHMSGRKVLFGEYSCARAERVVVVEGPLCQIALRRLGIPAVALCGKSLPSGSAVFFRGRRVVPCFDAPRDSREATTLYLDYERLSFDVSPYAAAVEDPIDLSSTGCKDPAEYIGKYGQFVI